MAGPPRRVAGVAWGMVVSTGTGGALGVRRRSVGWRLPLPCGDPDLGARRGPRLRPPTGRYRRVVRQHKVAPGASGCL